MTHWWDLPLGEFAKCRDYHVKTHLRYIQRLAK